MTAYTLGSLLYEGKAKRVYATDQPDLVAVEYKDDATEIGRASCRERV